MRCPALPQSFWRESDRVLIDVHMDDFYGTGPREAAEMTVERLREIFDLKATEVFKDGRVAHLRRDRLLGGGETLIRGNPAHIDTLVEFYGLQKSKRKAATPSQRPGAWRRRPRERGPRCRGHWSIPSRRVDPSLFAGGPVGNKERCWLGGAEAERTDVVRPEARDQDNSVSLLPP